jgi:hypothetical protein
MALTFILFKYIDKIKRESMSEANIEQRRAQNQERARSGERRKI